MRILMNDNSLIMTCLLALIGGIQHNKIFRTIRLQKTRILGWANHLASR